MQTAFLTIFGEVLFDNFPDGSRILGGAPFNVAWHLQAFGQQPLFISRIGEDQAGREILAAMQNLDMTRAGLQTDAIHPTGSVEISITDGQPGYRILEHQAYDYIDSRSLRVPTQQGLLYHGSLALRNSVSRHALEELKRNWQGQVFLDVNLRTPWWRAADVWQWISAADWLKLNDEELQILLPGEQSMRDKMLFLQQCHRLQGLVVTCGSQGALALTAEGEFASISPTGNVEVVDTVGAGDAFASVMLLGIAEQWPLSLTLQRAQDFASALVGQRGATVADPAFYRNFIEAWR